MPAARIAPWAAMLAAACLCSCIQPPDDTPDRLVAERLVGTWLREYEEDATRVRRILVLESDGRFRELATVSAVAGPATQHSHSGEWRFDGTNLKRRYTRMDGRQPAAPIVPFATFELKFQSPDEFLGVDNVHRRQVRYRRVMDGTLP
jgi:hypothetical protein